jgi:hypothetical protein
MFKEYLNSLSKIIVFVSLMIIDLWIETCIIFNKQEGKLV